MCGAAPAPPRRGERPQGGGPHLVGGHLAHRVPRLQRLQLLQAPVQLLQGLQRQLLLSILCCGAARRHGRVRGHEGGPGRSGPTEGCSYPRGAGTGRGCGAAQRPAVLSPVRGMVYRCPHASPRGDTQPGDPAGPHAPPGALLMEGLTSAEPFHHHRLDGAAENPTWIPKGKAFTAPHGRGKAAPPLRDSDLPLPPDPVCPRWDTHRTARPCWQRGGCCSTPACGTHRAEHHAASSSSPPAQPPPTHLVPTRSWRCSSTVTLVRTVRRLARTWGVREGLRMGCTPPALPIAPGMGGHGDVSPPCHAAAPGRRV